MSGTESRFHYACPRCGASMTATTADAGQRASCPGCGNRVKVPGSAAAAPPPLPPRRTADPQRLSFACPSCGTSISAGGGQTEAICPECLDNVPVPAPAVGPVSQADSEAISEAEVDSHADLPVDDSAEPAAAPLDDADELKQDAPAEPPSNDDWDDDESLLLGNPDVALDELNLEEPPIEAPAEFDSLEPLDAAAPRETPDPLADAAEPSDSDLRASEHGASEHGASEHGVSGPGAPDDQDSQPPGSWVDEFSFLCPVCGTRLTAHAGEVGRSKPCPDCHSSVPVNPPSSTTRRFRTSETEESEQDEYRIAPPVERTAGYSLHPGLIEQARREAEAGLPDDETLRSELADSEFGYPCSGCKTRLYAAMSDLGKTRRCPECGAENVVRVPPPPLFPRQANDSQGARKAREHWTEKPAPRSPTEGDDALRRARSESRKKDSERDELENVSPWRGVWEFLTDLPVVLRMAPLAFGLAVAATLFGWAVGFWDEGITWVVSLMLGVIVMFLGLGLAITAAVFFQAVVSDTANGQRRVSSWPDGMIIEWWIDSLFMLSALFLSSLPGVLFGQLTRAVGAPLWLLIFFALGSTWLLLPPVLLSMLETGSPLVPVSLPIWKSLLSASRKWLQFYGISAGLMLLLFFEVLLFLPNWLLINLVAAALVTATCMVYARLLGLLAWSCQEEFTAEDTAPAKAGPAKAGPDNKDPANKGPAEKVPASRTKGQGSAKDGKKDGSG